MTTLSSDLRWYRHPGTALVVVALGALVFYLIATGVGRGRSEGLDESILLWFRAAGDLNDPIGPIWVEEAMRDVTALGGLTVSAMAIGLLFVMELFVGRRKAALYHFVAIAVGLALTFYLKDFFQRPRPELVPHEARVLTKSFPSGHAATAALTHLTMGAFIARDCVQRRSKVLAIAAALLLSVSVGISRVYLGVHWPTDIFAGWVLGASWAWAAWIIEGHLRRRGTLEPLRSRGES
ncbi:phosphatidylglycerophosphatase B [Planctomycetes bacterium Poly30]|uniref:Phosphatidylglycerophosphatase B n=1 Tax=Saltatorellus ferox TaxID=2528018 RepID=A0A518ENJ3_9BACT|nr:phosphatidylglycerophosphatase B [Planctomycetes bacterium Poly30]